MGWFARSVPGADRLVLYSLSPKTPESVRESKRIVDMDGARVAVFVS